MQNIYETFNTATKGISAYAIMKDGQYVGKIVFKRVSSVTCFLHVFGVPMFTGKANGGGYDMCSASAANAADKLKLDVTFHDKTIYANLASIKNSLKDGSHSWDRYLTDAGFAVHQVI